MLHIAHLATERFLINKRHFLGLILIRNRTCGTTARAKRTRESC